jgi:hypothetical protein
MAIPPEPGQVESAPPDPICTACGESMMRYEGMGEAHPNCTYMGAAPADVDAFEGSP